MRFVSDDGTIELLDLPTRFDLSQLPEVVWDPQVAAFRAPPDVHAALGAALEATGVAFADQVRAAAPSAASATPPSTVTPFLGDRGCIDPALLARLILAGERLPDEVRRGILAAGPAAAPTLTRVLESDALARADAPGGGHAPAHAARCLGDLGARSAIAPLLRVLACTDPFDDLAFAVCTALVSIGLPVLEPALAAYARAASAGERFSLESVLTRLRVHDDRILALLLQVLERDPADGACLLNEYGDPAALPHLHAALDWCRLVRGGGPLANDGILALGEAILELEGSLTPAQREKVLVAMVERGLALEARRTGRAPRRAPGRNSPCPCGSGRKYKKCCLR